MLRVLYAIIWAATNKHPLEAVHGIFRGQNAATIRVTVVSHSNEADNYVSTPVFKLLMAAATLKRSYYREA